LKPRRPGLITSFSTLFTVLLAIVVLEGVLGILEGSEHPVAAHL
jgi:hypothetical protein